MADIENLPVVIEPLTAPDCDCRGLPFMPLEVERLRDSDLAALSTGDEFKAAVMLWCASWTQVPAASLPAEDRILARLAGIGLSEWRDVRDMALKGWIKCSDGRLYHPLIADHATNAFHKRTGQSKRATSRWAKERAKNSDKTVNPPIPRDSPGTNSAMQGTGTGREESTGAKAPSDSSLVDLFDDFPTNAFDVWYARYPNKVGKKEGAEAFRRLRAKKRCTFAELMDGLDRYIRDKPPDRSWLNPATFLNKERWADEPAPLTLQLVGSNGTPPNAKTIARYDNYTSAQRGAEVAARTGGLD